jgi:hypothetical protein
MGNLDAVEITEPFEISEFRVSGVARIEQIEEGLFEITFFKRKKGEQIANVALTIPAHMIPPMLVKLARAIGCDMVATCPAIKKATN